MLAGEPSPGRATWLCQGFSTLCRRLRGAPGPVLRVACPSRSGDVFCRRRVTAPEQEGLAVLANPVAKAARRVARDTEYRVLRLPRGRRRRCCHFVHVGNVALGIPCRAPALVNLSRGEVHNVESTTCLGLDNFDSVVAGQSCARRTS